MSLANLKKKALSLSDLAEKAESDIGKRDYTDSRFWKPTIDDSGNVYAEIRFLPPVEEENIPWAKYKDFGFKGPKGIWYFEKSLTTFPDTKDPVAEYNSQQWNDTSGSVEDQELRQKYCKQRRQKINYIFNIYVISDPANPEAEGKVFLYRAGQTIFKMISDAMKPQFQDEKPLNPFDLWDTGANFKLKGFTEKGFLKYDKSSFTEPASLDDNDDNIEKIYQEVYPLGEFTDPSNFKTYNELRVIFNKVMGFDTSLGSSLGSSEETMEEDTADDMVNLTSTDDEDDDDDVLAKLQELADDDD